MDELSLFVFAFPVEWEPLFKKNPKQITAHQPDAAISLLFPHIVYLKMEPIVEIT